MKWWTVSVLFFVAVFIVSASWDEKVGQLLVASLSATAVVFPYAATELLNAEATDETPLVPVVVFWSFLFGVFQILFWL